MQIKGPILPFGEDFGEKTSKNIHHEKRLFHQKKNSFSKHPPF